jgi:hypothetical protein
LETVSTTKVNGREKINVRNAGIVLLIVGLAMTLYTGFTYVTKEKVVDLGKIQITKDDDHTVSWQPYVGIAVMVIGGGALLLDRKKSQS